MEDYLELAKKFKNETLSATIILWVISILFYIIPSKGGSEFPLILPICAIINSIIYLHMRSDVRRIEKKMKQ